MALDWGPYGNFSCCSLFVCVGRPPGMWNVILRTPRTPEMNTSHHCWSGSSTPVWGSSGPVPWCLAFLSSSPHCQLQKGVTGNTPISEDKGVLHVTESRWSTWIFHSSSAQYNCVFSPVGTVQEGSHARGILRACEKMPRNQDKCLVASKKSRTDLGMCFHALLRCSGVRSLQLLVFILPYWKTCFCHVWLISVVEHHTHAILLNPQSINGLMLWVQLTIAWDFSLPHFSGPAHPGLYCQLEQSTLSCFLSMSTVIFTALRYNPLWLLLIVLQIVPVWAVGKGVFRSPLYPLQNLPPSLYR